MRGKSNVMLTRQLSYMYSWLLIERENCFHVAITSLFNLYHFTKITYLKAEMFVCTQNCANK